jgi:hypothetical protein
MNGKENEAELAIMSLVLVILSIAGIAAGFSRDLFGGIDGLLMLSIALMILLIFAILLVVQARQLGWIGKHKNEGGAAASPSK